MLRRNYLPLVVLFLLLTVDKNPAVSQQLPEVSLALSHEEAQVETDASGASALHDQS